MNATQREQYERALARADDEGVRVTWDEDDADGIRTFTITSRKHFLDGVDYTVKQVQPWLLSCNCPAGERGTYCKHRAAVRKYLEVEQTRAARRAAERTKA